MNIKEQIEQDLRNAFTQLNLDPDDAKVSVSTIDICDYQCNACFALAKKANKVPIFLADEIIKVFRSQVTQVTAVKPGFLNFKVNDKTLEVVAAEVLKSGKLPLAQQKKRTIFFDYGGANIAKELHVGHLRSPIVGEALKRVFEALGHKTIADVYLGDWGLQNGLILAELESQNFIKDDKFIKSITLDILNEVYPLASKKKNTDPAFKARADEITLLVQQKKAPWFNLWQQMRVVSVAKIHENYDKLNCTFDFYKGESDAQPYVAQVIDILKKKKLAYESENCLIMDVAKAGEHIPVEKTNPDEPQRYENPMPPIILQKYNGGDLYATNDVATLFYRSKDFAPDEFIYITDARQELHFNQVFRCVKKGGLVPEHTTLTHIGYGTMNGTDGKPFKTRAGGTIKFDEVISMVVGAALERLKQNQNGKNNNNELAYKIGLAALKFADLSNNIRKDYIFDIDKFTSFEGKTGPYILYTISRINSIFSKASDKNANYKIKCTNVERNVLVKVLKLADSYSVAAANYTLNGIADAAYTLAAEFNLFYSNNNILRQENKEIQQSYLALCAIVRSALKFAMNTLAIETVEEM